MFICGSLESGKDGVGDYTRGLAAECIRQGHPSIILALNDSKVSAPLVVEQIMEGIQVSVMRLPRAMPWAGRIPVARKWLDTFCPDWVSLQFVGYGFHPKGLVHGLAARLGPLLAGRKFHIMFHEIWLCKELGWGWQKSIVGWLQRFFIQRFVHATKPAVINTSNVCYAALLNQTGIPATELGLFGNVPILSKPGTTWIESQLRSVLVGGYRREAVWVFGFFGALHEQWPPEPLLTRLHRAAKAAGKIPLLLSIGRIGDAGADFWNRMAKDNANRFTFLRLGEQPPERISEYLSFLDCGIATTPRSIIGKSGTAVSMLEHGLPVIVNREDAPGVAGVLGNTEALLVAGDVHLENRLKAGLMKGPRVSRRSRIADDFLLKLENS
jgi:hypothetical protein